MKKIYLATPYTGTPEEQEQRFRAACLMAGKLMQDGHVVYSPIAHSHPISIISNMPGNHDFWKEQNRGWLEWCDEVWVGRIPGWKESKGAKWEFDQAVKEGKDVGFVEAL